MVNNEVLFFRLIFLYDAFYSTYKELSLNPINFFNFVSAKRGHTLILQRMFILCSPALAGLLFYPPFTCCSVKNPIGF